MATQIVVIYLLHASADLESVERFAASYSGHSPGAKHDLLIALKGFQNASAECMKLQAFSGIPHSSLRIPDHGFDVASYWFLARMLRNQAKHVLFMNTHSEILSELWLEKLYFHARNSSVGAAGATGSWMSHSLLSVLTQGSSPTSTEVGSRRTNESSRTSRRLSQLAAAMTVDEIKKAVSFPPFPNPHLRTNAFLVTVDNFLLLSGNRQKTKLDAYRFESGWFGMTRALQHRSLDCLVVGADGLAYQASEWPRSGVFWQGRQENLLIADNQTRRYHESSSELQAHLNSKAWGSPR